MKSETKTIKHTFSHEEREQLGADLARAFSSCRGVEAEFDQVKASYKSRTAEAEARIDRLSTNITNGFEMRDLPCWVVFRVKDKEKDYYLTEEAAAAASDGKKGDPPALTEKMTSSDFVIELIEAESKFDNREEINLFNPTEADSGKVVVGRLAGKWFTALRVKIGKLELNERLDAEQKCFKDRSVAISTAVKRVKEWSKTHLKDLAKGFEASFDGVVEANKERVE